MLIIIDFILKKEWQAYKVEYMTWYDDIWYYFLFG